MTCCLSSCLSLHSIRLANIFQPLLPNKTLLIFLADYDSLYSHSPFHAAIYIVNAAPMEVRNHLLCLIQRQIDALVEMISKNVFSLCKF